MARLSFKLDARRLYAGGLAQNVRCDRDRGAIVLDDWVLIEDDAAGCGSPFDQDTLREGTRVRKDLTVTRLPAAEARLPVYHGVEELWKTEPYEAPVRIAINGRPIEATLKYGWNAVEFDPAWLVEGDNKVIMAGVDASAPPIIPIADLDSITDNEPERRGAAQRSFKSEDGSKTWSPGLGVDSQTAGEYMIRLHLRQFKPAGEYVSPVMDLADFEGREAIKSAVTVRSFGAVLEQEVPPGACLSCFFRTGPTPVFDEDNWDRWEGIRIGQRCEPAGRYFQVRLLLTTDDPLESPAFHGLSVETEAEPAGTAGPARLKVEECRGRPVIRSSIPFEYEPLDEPLLKQLRETYRLDEVVGGVASQFERIVRLNHWIAGQWTWHPPEQYPEWNALEILEKQPDGESRGGFCGQYAIVMVQCCVAIGIQARFVFGCLPGVIYGHEVAEVWSDDYGKWVLMDPNMDRHYVDRETRIPLNALELHRAILQHYFEGSALGGPKHNEERVNRASFDEFLERGPVICAGGGQTGPDWFDPRRAHLMWGHPAMMPRNNFFSSPRPMPKAHGYGLPWSWNGYRFWFDLQTPRNPRFAGYTDRECDFYWTLNQVAFTLEQTAEEGVLRVSMDTFTPDLKALAVSVDGAEWTASAPVLLWRLRDGPNSLHMRTRNKLDVEGAPSWVRVSYQAGQGADCT